LSWPWRRRRTPRMSRSARCAGTSVFLA